MTAMESITFLNPETSIPFGKFTISTGNNEEGKRYYGGVIRGYADSTAQDYAENYDIRFEVLEDAPAVTTTAAAVTTTAKTVAATTAKTAATTTEKTTAATTAKTTAATTAKTAATTTVKTSPSSTVKTAATTTAKTVATTTVKTAAATTAKTAATTTQTTPLTTMGMTTTALLTTVVSTSAPDDTFRGKCGESATWAFNLVLENLTIGGDGDMQDYDIEGDNETPWFDYGIESRPMVQRIRKIEIEDGITGIGNNAFACCWSVKDIAVPGSVRSIGENAFYNCGALERLVILNKDCEIADSEWTVCSGIKDNHAFFDGKIIGFPGSTAQKYAEKYGYRFEALDFDPDSIYPVEGIIGYVKLVPYLNRDGYTEAEQAAYQKQADAFVKNIAKITVTGNFLMENEEDPDLTEMLYDETITVMEDPAELAKLSAYDSEPVVFAVMPDPYDAPGQIRYDVHFLDKDGKSLLDIHGETDTFTEKQVVRSYYNKTMTVVDLSKLTAENSGMLYSAENKSLSIEYAQTDYDCKTVLGDVDGSNDISVADAQTVLKAYTEQVAGKASGLDNGQTFAADVNRDSAVSVEDAQLILKYYTEKNVAGKDIAWKDILNPEQNAAAETPRKEKLSFKQIHPDNDTEQNTLQAYWLDISEKKDFVFDGDLLEIEIQVAEDAADGSYPFEIYYTDFSNYNANADEKGKLLSEVETKTGYVCVNQGAPSPSVLSDKMTLTVGSVSVKPGKTARLCVRIDNNPGFVGFIIRMRYNQDVMTVTQAAAGSDFAEAAKLTTYTLDEKA